MDKFMDKFIDKFVDILLFSQPLWPVDPQARGVPNRAMHKLTAAARNNDRGAMQCLVAASGLVRRAEREAGEEAPEAAAAAEAKLRHFDAYNGGHYSHTIAYHAVKMGLAVCPHVYLAAIQAAQESPSAEVVASVEEEP